MPISTVLVLVLFLKGGQPPPGKSSKRFEMTKVTKVTLVTCPNSHMDISFVCIKDQNTSARGYIQSSSDVFIMTGDLKPDHIDPHLSSPKNDDPASALNPPAGMNRSHISMEATSEKPLEGYQSSESDLSIASGPSSPPPKPRTSESAINKAPSSDEIDTPPSDLQRVARLIKSGKAKNVILLLGAGISTSAGIPDFRSPETGLYANLQALNLPFPEAVFELGYFRDKPEPFWTLAKEIYPGKHFPTPTHYFLALLHRHQALKRIFTQNIDTLETLAGVPPASIIEAHGSFATAHCLDCRASASREYVLASGVRRGEVVRCEKCGGLVKPDIVFFGEGLPDRFFKHVPELRKCDLLIVIGTSLQVHPFASLVEYVSSTCPRLLINREAVGPFSHLPSSRSTRVGDFRSSLAGILSSKSSQKEKDKDKEKRDMFWQGDADDGVYRLAEELGWRDELEKLVEEGRSELEKSWREAEGNSQAEAKDEEGGGEKQAKTEAKQAAEAVEEVVGRTEDDELEDAINRQLKL